MISNLAKVNVVRSFSQPKRYFNYDSHDFGNLNAKAHRTYGMRADAMLIAHLCNSHTLYWGIPPYTPLATRSMIPLAPPAFTPSPSPSLLVVSLPHQEANFGRVGYPEYRPRFVFSSPSARINEVMPDLNEMVRTTAPRL
jgi:hypothetical protein